jgi:type II secretory pathway pseudopilin PulG
MSAGKENRGQTPKSQEGFTLLGALLTIAVMGAGLAAYGELVSHAAQREKEQELLFVGNQFRQAIGSYYERTPGAVKRFPQKLEDLLEDKRYPMPQRHLRKLYADPISGKPQWGVIEAPGGGIMGVHSLSEAPPIKTGGFAPRDRTLAETARYSDWHFSYVPTGPVEPAAAAEKASVRAEAKKG